MNTTLLVTDNLITLAAWIATFRGNATLGKLLIRGHNAIATLLVHGGEKNVGTLPGSDGSSGSSSVSG